MPRGRAFHKPLRATRTEYGGVVYDSKAEAERAAVLDGMKRAGVVRHVLRQVKCDVGEPGVDQPYRVDFLALGNRPDPRRFYVWAEDVKGADSPTFRRHVKQWERRGGIPLRIIRRGKLEDVVEGGSGHPEPASRASTVVNGIKRRNKAVADRAFQLAGDLHSTVSHAVYRDVDVHVEGLPRVDFLVVSTCHGGESFVRAELVVADGKPPAPDVLDRWKASGPVDLRVFGPGSKLIASVDLREEGGREP